MAQRAARYRHAVVTQLANLTWRQRRTARRCSRILRWHRDAATRQDACEQLERTGAPGAAQALADAAAHDENHYVRATALMALARLDARPFAGVFNFALTDRSSAVVEAAIKGLIAVGDPSHAQDVAVHLDHELHLVRRPASAALYEWDWATDDVRRAHVALAREAWTEVAALDVGAVAEVARLLANDRYWFTYTTDRERQLGIRALEQLVERHAVQLSDAELHIVEHLALLEAPVPDGRDEHGRPRYYRKIDLTGLRRLCSAELQRRASDEHS
ncbi:HEAT repeat domain-containing protein [Streptomyces sp. NPDC055752]